MSCHHVIMPTSQSLHREENELDALPLAGLEGVSYLSLLGLVEGVARHFKTPLCFTFFFFSF